MSSNFVCFAIVELNCHILSNYGKIHTCYVTKKLVLINNDNYKEVKHVLLVMIVVNVVERYV
jgi:hypothetical protein